MNRCNLNRFRLIVMVPVLTIAALSFLFTACLPGRVDADSCIYLTVDGKVMIRDIDAKTSREITALESGEAEPKFPGKWLKLCPNKDRFVIAQFSNADDQRSIVFDFYSLGTTKQTLSIQIRFARSVGVAVSQCLRASSSAGICGTDGSN